MLIYTEFMKTLFLVRHAKSDWNDVEFNDFERPLNHRGLRNAPLMAQRLKLLNVPVELIISSPAKRALHTSQIFAQFLDYPLQKIKIVPELYGADAKRFLKTITGLPSEINTAIIFGHNPTITDMVEYLADYKIDKLPTTGIAMIAFDIQEWKMVSKDLGELKMLDYPKKM